MNMYNYVFIHVPGVQNVWADLLGQWSAPLGLRRIISVPHLVSSQGEYFEWPTADALPELQQKHISIVPKDMKLENGLYVNESGAAWIPDPAEVSRSAYASPVTLAQLVTAASWRTLTLFGSISSGPSCGRTFRLS